MKLTLPPGARYTDFLSALGHTGMTAYFGMIDICDPKPGETVVVSGAAGAVGMIAAQIAKIKGARVVGIAGGEQKCRWLKDEVGLDEVIDYKAGNVKEALEKATPKYIDAYFDNGTSSILPRVDDLVGGSILDDCLGRAAPHSRYVPVIGAPKQGLTMFRFAICGAISQYNTRKPVGPKNFNNIIAQRIFVKGFIIMDSEPRYPEAQEHLAKWLSTGRLKRREYIVEGGVEKAEEGLRALFEGKNLGKCLVKIGRDKSRL